LTVSSAAISAARERAMYRSRSDRGIAIHFRPSIEASDRAAASTISSVIMAWHP